MTGLLSLPTELLQDIGAEVATSPGARRFVDMGSDYMIQSHHNLRKAHRLVCKQVNLAWEPQILSTIMLSPKHLSSQVEGLATTEPKPTSASKYATRLEIQNLYPREDRHVLPGEEAKVRSFLFPAVASLTGVRTVIWDLGVSDPEWAVLLVLDALASLPLLQDLHLTRWTVPKHSWQLRQLPHIVNFSFASAWGLDCDCSIIIPVSRFIGWNQPKLKSLTIDNRRNYSSKKSIQNLNDFLFGTPDSAFLNITHLNLSGLVVKLEATLIPHLRSLISLHLRDIFLTEDQASGNPGPSTGNIWSSLRSANIHLQDIVTDYVQLALIEYLTSFSGLRRFRLTRASPYSMSPLPSDQLAIMFYERALQNHVRSLESLDVDAGYEGNWCFTNHCAGIIQQCACLTTLKLSINSKDIGEEDDNDNDDEDEDGNEDGDDDDGDGDEEHSPPGRGNRNAVWLLLDICANLPVLRVVELFSASQESTRGYARGYTAGRHARVNGKIANRVKSYGPITSGHAFRVSTICEEFELRCDELGMNVGYRRISTTKEY